MIDDELKAMMAESDEIFNKIEPLLHDHDCEAVGGALAQLFACWLHLDNADELLKNALRFNKLAIVHYDIMRKLDEKEMRH